MKPLRTTRDRAATLARIVDAIEAGKPLTPSQVGYRPSILVEAIGSIPGNTTAQHTVRIVEPLAGIPTATAATMLVRHCGVSTLAAGARLMAEYCGQIGYVIQRGGGTPKFSPVIQRYFRPNGPLAAESQGETTDWVWGQFGQYAPTPYRYQYGWTLPIDFSATPATANYRSTWTVKSYPFRFKIEGYGEQYAGGNQRMQSPVYGRDCQPYDWARQANFVSPLNARWPLSDVTPPANSHLENFRCDGAFMPLFNGVSRISGATPWPWDFGVIAEVFASGDFVVPNVSCTFRKARVWIDGVDRSGIVTPTFTTFTDNGTSLQIFGAKTTTTQTPAQKSVWLDCWVDVAVSVPSWAVSAMVGTQQALILPGFAARMQGVIGQMDWFETVGTSRQWSLAFDANGPGGQTSITSAAGNGLIYESSGSPPDRVDWYTDREVAYITIAKAGPHASPKAGTALYLPEDSGDYEPLRFANGGTLTAGCWDPDAATVYRRVGGSVASQQIGAANNNWIDLHNAGDPTEWDALYDDYPETVTVSPA